MSSILVNGCTKNNEEDLFIIIGFVEYNKCKEEEVVGS
jgi:hypothetical protein